MNFKSLVFGLTLAVFLLPVFGSNAKAGELTLEGELAFFSDRVFRGISRTGGDVSGYGILDPIDGTRAFIKGAKDFSICVALLKGDRPILSVLFAPARDEFFSAMKNQGAFLNNNKIQVGTASRIPGMKLQGDEGYFKNVKRWQTPWPEMTFGKYQSFALRIASVAAGNFDAAISARPKSEWDVAAADLIVTEAGGICCDGEGKAFVYNQKNTRLAEIVATIPGLLPEILERMQGRKPKNTS